MPLPTRFLLLALLPLALAAAENRTRNLVLVTLDGLRWQEVFHGADETLLNKDKGGVPDNQLQALRDDFWADTPEARRQKLMPFFWGTIAKDGQVFGNRDAQSPVAVLNPQWVSYPGYNELLTGRPSELVVSNAPIPNPNVTVLEWLEQRPAFRGRVAACTEWKVFSAILNVGRSRLPVWTTRQHSPPSTATPRLLEIERWMDDIPPIAPDEHYDAFVYQATLDTFEHRQPRVFLLAFGEPDAHAHSRRYDRYLWSIQRCDRFIRQLWEILQAQPQYRGTTTFVLTPDHGRGVTPDDWTSHGAKVPRSNETWFAAFGPDTPPKGERRNTPEIHQAQIAATLAALLGEDFRAAVPEAAAPIAEILHP
jgi:hypothetical protein